jgi:hypothetical protein
MITLFAIIFSGMIISLYMWTKVNNNALTPWNHPMLLLLAFCLHWGMFGMMLLEYRWQNQTYNKKK